MRIDSGSVTIGGGGGASSSTLLLNPSQQWTVVPSNGTNVAFWPPAGSIPTYPTSSEEDPVDWLRRRVQEVTDLCPVR